MATPNKILVQAAATAAAVAITPPVAAAASGDRRISVDATAVPIWLRADDDEKWMDEGDDVSDDDISTYLESFAIDQWMSLYLGNS